MRDQQTDTATDNPEDILGFMKDHIRRYLATGGEDGHWMNGYPCLVLTTKGKKSGEPRQAAVIYGTDGRNHVVVDPKEAAPFRRRGSPILKQILKQRFR